MENSASFKEIHQLLKISKIVFKLFETKKLNYKEIKMDKILQNLFI